MNTKLKELVLYAVWLCLYILCVGLGTVEDVAGIGKVLFLLTSLIFFVPGVLLLVTGFQTKNKRILRRVRIVAICSLVLTVVVFCANVFAVAASSQLGSFLNDLLNLVSAPMFCSQYWVMSLFCWACLLWGSFTRYDKK